MAHKGPHVTNHYSAEQVTEGDDIVFYETPRCHCGAATGPRTEVNRIKGGAKK